MIDSKGLNLLALIISLVALFKSTFPPVSQDVIGAWMPSNDQSSHEDRVSPYTCETPSYKTRILSYDPLIIHLENFLTRSEREHFLELSENKFEKSSTMAKNGSSYKHDIRTSSTSFVNTHDPILDCLYDRFSEFQGYHSLKYMETFQVTKYEQGEQYGGHYDWFAPWQAEMNDNANRISTFFGILEAECENCGTRFMNVSIDWSNEDKRWCDIVECDDTEYLTVKSIPGNMVFWKNLRSDGFGDPMTMHAGLPLKSGRKTGLNVWSLIEVEPLGSDDNGQIPLMVS